MVCTKKFSALRVDGKWIHCDTEFVVEITQAWRVMLSVTMMILQKNIKSHKNIA